MSEYLRQGGEQATEEGRRHLGNVDRGDHECVAGADLSEEAAQQDKAIVGTDAHEEGTSEEDEPNQDDRVAAANPVRGPPRHHRSEE